MKRKICQQLKSLSSEPSVPLPLPVALGRVPLCSFHLTVLSYEVSLPWCWDTEDKQRVEWSHNIKGFSEKFILWHEILPVVLMRLRWVWCWSGQISYLVLKAVTAQTQEPEYMPCHLLAVWPCFSFLISTMGLIKVPGWFWKLHLLLWVRFSNDYLDM